VRLQYFRRSERKFRREEAHVVADDHCGRFRLRQDMFSYRGGRATHSRKSEVVGNHAAPTRSPEMNRLVRHGQLLYLGPQAVNPQHSK